MTKRKFISFLQKQSFQPGIAGLFVNPFYFIRRALYMNIKDCAPQMQGKLLDFGCGRKPYKNLFLNVSNYIGIDIEQTGHDHTYSQVDVFYDGKTIPFEDNSFDSIFCSEVLEHVFNIEEILVELNRVLKPGGSILLTIPFCWNEHEIPFDFGRYTSFGLKHLLEKKGFTITESRKSGNFVRVNIQLGTLYIFEIFGFLRSKTMRYSLSMLLIIPINIAGFLTAWLLPKNQSLYFNNVVIAKKL